MANRSVTEWYSAVDGLLPAFEQVYDRCHGGDRGWGGVTRGLDAGVEAERLEAELAVVCGQLNQVSARLVALTARAIASQGWAGAGIRSVEHWLVLRAGLSPVRARQVVVMARRVEVLPVVMGRFAAGRLSVDQVAVVARHAPAHVEASVAELAVCASVPQLGRVLSRYAFDPPTGDDPEFGAVSGSGSDADSEAGSEAVPDLVSGAVAVEPALDEGGRAGEPAELSMDYEGGWPVRAAVLGSGRCRGAGGGGAGRGPRRPVRRGYRAGDVGRCVGGGVCSLGGVGDLP